MHMGSMAVLARTRCGNLIHIVFNNGAHESVGGMPVAYGETDFCELAKACGYDPCLKARDQDELEKAIDIAQKQKVHALLKCLYPLVHGMTSADLPPHQKRTKLLL